MFLPLFFLGSLGLIIVGGSAIAWRRRRSDDYARLGSADAPSGINNQAKGMAAAAQVARNAPGPH